MRERQAVENYQLDGHGTLAVPTFVEPSDGVVVDRNFGGIRDNGDVLGRWIVRASFVE